MLAYLEITLIEVLLWPLFLSSLSQPQEKIVFDVLELDGRDASLDYALSEGVDVILKKRDRADKQIVASADQVDIQKDMMPHQAVDTLIVGYSIPWPELHNDLAR